MPASLGNTVGSKGMGYQGRAALVADNSDGWVWCSMRMYAATPAPIRSMGILWTTRSDIPPTRRHAKLSTLCDVLHP